MILLEDEVKHKGPYDPPGLLAKAEGILEKFPGRIDAIVGYWDFPVSSMLSLLRQKFNLPSPTLAAVARCEHKYWNRVEQRRVLPECTPRFAAVDPFADPPERIDVNVPFWIKPVKSLRSYLAFRIGKASDLKAAIPMIKDGIPPRGGALQSFSLPHRDV